ncbi:hypothetical protein STAL104432_30770 [Streptomyces albus]
MLGDHTAHQRLVHGAAAAVRATHLDTDDLPALRRGDHDRLVRTGRRGRRGAARRIHPRHVRDQMRQRDGEPFRIDLGLDRRRVHRELGAARPDQLDGALDPRGDDRVHRHRLGPQPLLAGVQPLVAEYVVHQRRHPGVAGGQMVEGLVRLGPQLPGGVGRQTGQLRAQLLQRPAQRLLQHGPQLGLPGGDGVVGAAVGEREHRAHQLVAVAHRGGRHVHRHRTPVLGPQHLPGPDPVLAAGAQRVGQRRLLERQRTAVRPRVVHQRVELLAAQIAGAVAQDLRGGGVDEHDTAGGVHPDHALGGGTQDHLRLPLLAGQFRLGVQRARQIPYDEHQQLVPRVPGATGVVGEGRVYRGGVRRPPVLKVGAGHLDRELGAVGTPRDHAGRLLAALGRRGFGGTPHRAWDPLRVELGQQVEQSAPHQRRTGRLEGLQRDGVGVHHRAVAVHQEQRVGQGVEYGGEASSASGWPAAHGDNSLLLTSRARDLPPVPSLLVRRLPPLVRRRSGARSRLPVCRSPRARH